MARHPRAGENEVNWSGALTTTNKNWAIKAYLQQDEIQGEKTNVEHYNLSESEKQVEITTFEYGRKESNRNYYKKRFSMLWITLFMKNDLFFPSIWNKAKQPEHISIINDIKTAFGPRLISFLIFSKQWRWKFLPSVSQVSPNYPHMI